MQYIYCELYQFREVCLEFANRYTGLFKPQIVVKRAVSAKISATETKVDDFVGRIFVVRLEKNVLKLHMTNLLSLNSCYHSAFFTLIIILSLTYAKTN